MENGNKKKRFKIYEGDIFTIDISEKLHGYGQIISKPHEGNFMMIVFNLKTESELEIETIVNSEILFMGLSLDAKLYHNHWKIIGNSKANIDKIELPVFKLGLDLIDYNLKIIENKFGFDINNLSNHTTFSPIRFENALKAYFGFGEWNEDYERLLYSKQFKLQKNIYEN